MKKLFLALILVNTTLVVGQEQDTIKNKLKFFGGYEHNGQWYTNDVNRKIQHDSVPLRSNNYLSLNLNYGKFTVGTQVESYVNEALLNFNPEYRKTNIGTFYANYKSNKLDVTLGHFYEQFGSGLALRTWEDRSLGINNALRGARIKYAPIEGLELRGLYGRQRTGFAISAGHIFGLNLEAQLATLFNWQNFNFNYGFSYVGRNETFPEEVLTKADELTSVFSNRLEFNRKGFYFNTEYVFKTEDVIYNLASLKYDFVKPGNALLLNFGFAKKGFGIDVNLRRIENMMLLSERKPTAYPALQSSSLNYNDKFLNFIPSLTKQHHSNLANIYVYQSQSQLVMNESTNTNKFGEIGGQVDVFYEFKKGSNLGGKYGTKIALNLASWYNLKAKFAYYDAFGNSKLDYKTDFSGSKEKYFSDYNIEISKKLTPKIKSSIAYINQYYNNQQIQGIFQDYLVKTNILFVESTFILPKSKAITVSAEHMWANNDRKNWLGGSIEYNHNANWSIFAMDMFNYGYDESIHPINSIDLFDIHFYNFGTAYKKGSTRIALNYGRQRGGLVCAGGVCRFVPPSTGLGLQITTSF
ncbi:Protein of unknown function precursor [Flavobacterium indicum GPTSA100-9 = DSM 17447]|uniref:Uncharacterized protein n=1 Tax=Flavobacterium indicum (strain DSM 17447 / CIP 109464 / GPTSA100-9) TaxID=1094466 RepID=H8XP22_FLAIG|nr:DUF6029 family protein [Flavobacterium indicum]CCG52289.1 Protein of unknown function precursor [Flavobacterium indicum GPTSA100-9 = DSM 17447]